MALFKTDKKNYCLALGAYFADFKDGYYRTNKGLEIRALRLYPTNGRDFVEIDEKTGKVIKKESRIRKKK